MPEHYSQWNLSQWLNSLENRHVQEIQLGLMRIKEVAKSLDLLAPQCQVITVSGTNGKGSTVAALETIYHSAGYVVGAYTSPHLIRFNERIRLNLEQITDVDLCHCFCQIEEAAGSVALTYFEMTTLAALLYFKQQQLDVLILEVGLGGRLDATNIIDADLAIITGVDFDHQDFLGSTLEAIGYEKAGILRPNKYFIYADEHPPISIINKALALQTVSYYYGKDYFLNEYQSSWELIFGEDSITDLPIPSIQLKSAAAALVAVHLLKPILPIEQQVIFRALPKVFVPGRLQLVSGRVSILYDVSHNPQSAQLLAKTIKNLNIKNKVHAVFSALQDKDMAGMIAPLKSCVHYWYPARLSNKRSSSTEYLLKQFKNAEILINICYNTPLVAFETAFRQSVAGDLIVVFGSFFTVGQVMSEHCNLLEQKEI